MFIIFFLWATTQDCGLW